MELRALHQIHGQSRIHDFAGGSPTCDQEDFSRGLEFVSLNRLSAIVVSDHRSRVAPDCLPAPLQVVPYGALGVLLASLVNLTQIRFELGLADTLLVDIAMSS